MKRKQTTVLVFILAFVVIAGVLSGCSKQQSTTIAKTEPGGYKDFNADEKLKVAFVCKFLTSVWFAPKSRAMQERAAELGIEYIPIDANDNEDTFMQGVQNAINQDVDGIILTPVNTSMLPAIVDLCKAAGVAYMTTDDGGVDADGNRVPHLGLDDYALGKDSATEMVKAARERGFFANPSRVKVIMIDVPAVESFHNRLVGGYDVVKSAAPEIPEENYIWLDTVNGLVDNVVAKFSSQYQAIAAGTEYFIILGGDEGAPYGTYTILQENGVDFNKVLCSTINGSDMATTMMDENETIGRSIFFSGILPAPSGVALIDVMNDLFRNETPIPQFTGYPKNVCDYSNYKKNFVDFL
jgi:ABC-type sugar transport system substrate-binding protein